jgi:predicted transcriptional regulator
MRRETNRKRETNRVTTSFRVEPDLLEQFKAKAERNFRSPSWEIRRLMSEYVNAEEEAQAA